MGVGTISPQPASSRLAIRPEHVTAIVANVLRKSPDARVIGIRVSGAWRGGEHVDVAGVKHPVAFCPSRLAVQEALATHDASGDGPPLVLLTPLSDDELGWDVRVRLAKRRLMHVIPWDLVADLFHARAVDPRITPHRWMADALLEHVPAGGYTPVPSGVLDADTAWAQVLRPLLGLSTGRPDAEALLEASLDPRFQARFDRLPDEARAALRERVESVAGRLGARLVDALKAGHGRQLVAIGLVAEVLFPPEAPAGGELARAAVRLETYVGGEPLEAELGRRWFDAVLHVLEKQPEDRVGPVLQHAEDMLAELRADAFIASSTVLPASYERRLADFGKAIDAFLDSGSTSDPVEAALARIEQHRLARRESERGRCGRLHMAARLVRFLERRTTVESAQSRSLPEATVAYAREGAYVDWARTLLLGGEQVEPLAGALDRLGARVREVREAENRRFAERLAEWHRSPAPDVLPIERVIEKVVAPAAAAAPVLFLVLDGMSVADFLQLREGVLGTGWEAWWPESMTGPAVAIAAVPSITRISRASLLAGRITTGAAADEVRMFRENRALVAHSRASKPPRLFHKGELTEGTNAGLAEDVRTALSDPDQRVVGIILNAVDDALAKSDQVVPQWTVDRIRLLAPILSEAQRAGRVVILASDHGHVLESATTAIDGGDEERWRAAEGEVAEMEIVIAGSRIQAATGTSEIIAPWSEQVRYVRKKAGYHGGVTPQEVVVPIAVLAPWDRGLEGWHIVIEDPPRWWFADASVGTPIAEPESAEPVESRRARKARPAVAQPSLFGDPIPPAAPAKLDWIARLLASPVFAAQRELAGKLAPTEDMVRRFLELLDRHHGRVSRAAVARALGQPEIRVRGIIAGLQRMLNVDGYPIVVTDEATDSVELQLDLLRRQFQVEA